MEQYRKVFPFGSPPRTRAVARLVMGRLGNEDSAILEQKFFHYQKKLTAFYLLFSIVTILCQINLKYNPSKSENIIYNFTASSNIIKINTTIKHKAGKIVRLKTNF